MKKFNWKGLVAILTIATGIIILLHDLYKLAIGYCYTGYGLFTLLLVIGAMSIASDYIEERLKKIKKETLNKIKE